MINHDSKYLSIYPVYHYRSHYMGYLCVCECLCLCSYLLCAYGTQRSMLSIFLYHSQPYFWNRLVSDLELTVLALLVGSEPHFIASAGVVDMCRCMQLSHGCCRSDLSMCIYALSCLPSPHPTFLFISCVFTIFMSFIHENQGCRELLSEVKQ